MGSFMFQQTGGGSGGGVDVWATATPYTVNTPVIYGGSVYICSSAHTSGASIEADIALSRWVLAGNYGFASRNLMIAGSTFESNSVQGWVATGCATVTNGLPVSVGSGGAAFSTSNGGRAKGANTTAAAVTSSGAIDDTYSLNLATSAAGTIGDGYISQSIPVPTGYQAKALTITFKYKVASGTPVMAGTSANTYACAVYDITNNAWIGMAGNFNFVQSSGVGDFVGTFQTASNTAAIQIFVYSPVAPTGASSLLLDNFYVGQQATQKGPAVSDWVAYTPTFTGFGTQSNVSAWYRRVGSDLELDIRFQAGTSTAVEARISLPTGMTSDSTRILTLTEAGMYSRSTSSAAKGGFVLIEPSVSYITFGDFNTIGSGTVSSLAKAVGTAVENNASVVSLTAKVPISGWSSNSVMSQDTDTRVVTAIANLTSGSHITSGSYLDVAWTSTVLDTHGAWNGTTYTIPVTGQYNISGQLASVANATGVRVVALYYNGAIVNYSGPMKATSGTDVTGVPFSFSVNAKAGDTFKLQYNQTSGGSLAYATSGENHLHIFRLSGPAVIAASETVACRYSNTAGTTWPTSFTTIPYATKAYDTHGAYNTGTGVYTVPVSGKYKVYLQATTAAVTIAVGQGYFGQILKNGSVDSATLTAFSQNAGGGMNYTINANPTIQCNAGDTIAIQLSGSVATTLYTSVGYNYFCIDRVGN